MGAINQWGGKLAFFFTYTHLSHDLTTGLLLALLPFIREDLGLSYLQAGFLVSAYSLTSGLSQFLGGWLSDRLNRRTAIALGLGGVGLSAVATGLAPSYPVMLVTLVVLGILSGFYHPSAISALTNHFGENQRGRVIAMHMVGGNLGFGISPILGAIIASKLNWHFAYAMLGVPALVAAAMVFTQLKMPAQTERPKDLASSPAGEPKSIGIWRVFKTTAGIMVISVSMQLITGPIMSFIPLFLVDVHHLTAAASSTWMAVIRMGGLAGGLLGGWLADKWGRRNTIFLTLSLIGPAVLAISRLPFGLALSAFLVLFGWLMTMRETTMQTYLMDRTPPRLRATVFGIYFGFGQEGSSIIQPIAGNFMDMVGIAGVYRAIALISTSLSVLVVILASRSAGRNKIPGSAA